MSKRICVCDLTRFMTRFPVSNVDCGSAFAPGTYWWPHDCAPLVCVPDSRVWWVCKKTKRKSSTMVNHSFHSGFTPLPPGKKLSLLSPIPRCSQLSGSTCVNGLAAYVNQKKKNLFKQFDCIRLLALKEKERGGCAPASAGVCDFTPGL